MSACSSRLETVWHRTWSQRKACGGNNSRYIAPTPSSIASSQAHKAYKLHLKQLLEEYDLATFSFKPWNKKSLLCFIAFLMPSRRFLIGPERPGTMGIGKLLDDLAPDIDDPHQIHVTHLRITAGMHTSHIACSD
jgi:hypothetical protein